MPLVDLAQKLCQPKASNVAVEVGFASNQVNPYAADATYRSGNPLVASSFQPDSLSQPRVIDNLDSEFAPTGAWVGSSGGYLGSVYYSAAGDGSDVVTWTLTGLPAGQYQVSARWSSFVNRATNAPYKIFDGVTEIFSTTVNQRLAPQGDAVVSGKNFQELGVVTINSGTLVVQLTDNANGYVIADAIRVSPFSDLAAPTAQMSSPVDGGTITPDTLNAQGYLEVTFADVGEGLDTSSINGNEISIGGSGVGTAVLSGTATLVSGATYRYGFSGSFVEGPVSVQLVAGSFQDLAATPNLNTQGNWGFTVATLPPFQTTVVDDGDAGFSTTGAWAATSGGYQSDIRYSAAGSGADVATWTLTGLPAGQYEVSATWSPFVNRATNAPYKILDGATEVFSTTVNQRNAPQSDAVESGKSFQNLGAVTINSGTLVVQISDDADYYVIADAIRVSPFSDTAAPTAQMSSPVDGGTITPDTLNTQGFLEVTFADVGEGLDTSSINGNEISLGGGGVGTAVLSGTATLVGGTTYRYGFSGSFVDGPVSVQLVAGSFQDLAATPNLNAQGSWDFTVAVPPPFQTTIMDDGDAGFSTTGAWVATSGGYQSDIRYNAAGSGADVAAWTLTDLPAGQYQVSATWSPFVNRATNAPYKIFDGATEVFSTTVNQRNAPQGDAVGSGKNFQNLGVVTINSGTLVIELSDDADYYVIADAIRVSPFSDLDAPTAQMSSPFDGGTISPDALNAQGYLEVTYADVGEGLDMTSIDGNEISISGAGVGTAVLDGTATHVGGTTFRYGFSGVFVQGLVAVVLVPGSFQDLAVTPNVNAQSDWSFTVAVPPPFQTTIIDDGDAGFSASGAWAATSGGYQSDIRYNAAGTGTDVASWTLSDLPAGQYQVSATWSPFVNRATNAPYKIFDGSTEVFSTTVNQRIAPEDDAVDSGKNFQILGVVTINSGMLVVELSDDANGYVIADAIRVSPYSDLDAPTAQISSPVDGATITPNALNAQQYLDVTFADVGEGIDTSSINGNEISLSGAGVGTAVLSGTATLVSGTTYRYGFNGTFIDGPVSVHLIAGSFQDLAATPNLNAQGNWSFVVATPPPFQSQVIDNRDPEFSTTGIWASTAGGHLNNIDYSAAGDGSKVATWTLTGLPAGRYEVTATWTAHSNRATNAPFKIFDGTTEVLSTAVSQETAPRSDVVESGTNFQRLGNAVTINSGTLVVQLSDNANEFVIADAVRVEYVPEPGSNLPELPRTYIDTTFALPVGGQTHTVNAGDDLQATIDTAAPGDVIVLQAGATFTGNFVLPNKTGDDWIYIVSSQLDQLPEGTRVGPDDAVHMPKIVSPNADPALMTMFGAHHYRVTGIEMSVDVANYNLVLLGFGVDQPGDPLWSRTRADSLDKLPHDITFDRVFLHSTSEINRARTGILADGKSIAVVDSHLSNFKDSEDAQAIVVWGGEGPFKVQNNYLEATGENIMFGGADPAIQGIVPSDIEIRGNHLFKPLAWQVSNLWQVKNLFELKNAQRVLFTENVLENNWLDSQDGTAVLFTPRNQNGTAPQSVVRDITFEHNILRNAVNGFLITGEDDINSSAQSQRILISDNVVDEIERGFITVATPGRPILDLTIRHNTFVHAGVGNDAVRLQSAFTQTQNFVFEDNILTHGDYGLTISSERASNYHFRNNVIVFHPGERAYGWYIANFDSAYPGNSKADVIDDVGFIDQNQGDLRLSNDSPYRNGGTDGKDIGADFDLLPPQSNGLQFSGAMHQGSVIHVADYGWPVAFATGEFEVIKTPLLLEARPIPQNHDVRMHPRPLSVIVQELDQSKRNEEVEHDGILLQSDADALPDNGPSQSMWEQAVDQLLAAYLQADRPVSH